MRRETAGLGLLLLLAPCSGEGQRGEQQGAIEIQNASGRTGAYYLPAVARERRVPLLVVLHGSGGSGGNIISLFVELAQARGFAIIAPDSRIHPTAGATWEVGDKQGDVTPDLTHVMDCIEWVRGKTGLLVDESRVLIAGYSGGASSAPYIASNRLGFTHAAVLHGGVFAGGIGPRRFRAWFSTGELDRYRPVAHVQQAATALQALGFPDLTIRSYGGGHDLSDAELQDLIDWWLGP